MENLLLLRILDVGSFGDTLCEPQESLSKHLSASSFGQRTGVGAGERTKTLPLALGVGV